MASTTSTTTNVAKIFNNLVSYQAYDETLRDRYKPWGLMSERILACIPPLQNVTMVSIIETGAPVELIELLAMVLDGKKIYLTSGTPNRTQTQTGGGGGDGGGGGKGWVGEWKNWTDAPKITDVFAGGIPNLVILLAFEPTDPRLVNLLNGLLANQLKNTTCIFVHRRDESEEVAHLLSTKLPPIPVPNFISQFYPSIIYTPHGEKDSSIDDTGGQAYSIDLINVVKP
jgi:hypothetical protein